MSISQYPFNGEPPTPRRTIIVGKRIGIKLRGELIRLSQVADRKRLRPTRAELTPAIQTPEERAEGDTTNARMTRLLYG